MSCETKGASIGYKVKNKNGIFSDTWNLYQTPISIDKDSEIMIEAHRIGYVPSHKSIKTEDLKH